MLLDSVALGSNTCKSCFLSRLRSFYSYLSLFSSFQSSYTRGTTIPLSLTITLSSPDTQALDLLASPSSPNVHLLRDVRYGSETTQGQTGNASIAKTGMKPNLAMKSAVTQVASAVWWMPSSSSTTNQGSESGLSKRLEGEIQLPSDIPPSFLFAKLEINVSYL